MAEFSLGERVFKAVLGPACLCGWWYLGSDYSRVLSTPLGKLTLPEIFWPLCWVLLLLPVLYGTISWFYEALTGRDAVWF
jgi:hypothetical protein